MTLTAIDHLVVRVADLETAMRDWGRRFHVVPGGRHDTGSHNALIGLADGSYIELLAFPQAVPDHPWYPLAPGLIDFCVATSDLDRALTEWAGVSMQPPFEMSRRRPDGYLLRWRLALPAPHLRGEFPFLIEDITPRHERVPPPAANAPALTTLIVQHSDPLPYLPTTLGPHRIELHRSAVPHLEALLTGDEHIH